MFPRTEARTDPAALSRAPLAGARPARTAAPDPRGAHDEPRLARLRRAADLLLAFVSLDALGLPAAETDREPHPHRRPASVALPQRRAGSLPRRAQVCVTPRLQATRRRDGASAR